MRGSAVVGAAVVFSVAMGALSHGGWWWVWLAAIALLLVNGRVRLPLLGGIKVDAATRYVLRQNQITRRHNRAIARQRRRRISVQRRARRARRRQAQ